MLYRKILILVLVLLPLACALGQTDDSANVVAEGDSAKQRNVSAVSAEKGQASTQVDEQNNLALGKEVLSWQKSMLDSYTNILGILLAVVALVLGYGVFQVRASRKEVDKELREIRDRRDQIDEVYYDIKKRKRRFDNMTAAVGMKAKRSVQEATESSEAKGLTSQEERLKLIDEGDARESVEEYERLLFLLEAEGIPKNSIPPLTHKNVGLNYARLERWERAQKELAVYLAEMPEDEYALFYQGVALGGLYNATNDTSWLDKALTMYEKAAQIKPNFHEAFFNWGNALSRMFDATKETEPDTSWLTQAFDKYEKASTIKPDDHEAFCNWGVALVQMFGATEETELDTSWLTQAFDKYAKAAAIKPNDHKILCNWGLALLKMHGATLKTAPDISWLTQAIEKFEKATTLNPNDHQAFYVWGVALWDLFKSTGVMELLKDAIAKTTEALKLAPERKDYNYILACCHALKEEKDEMLAALREAIGHDPKTLKPMARETEDFKAYRDDPDFIALTKDDEDEPA